MENTLEIVQCCLQESRRFFSVLADMQRGQGLGPVCSGTSVDMDGTTCVMHKALEFVSFRSAGTENGDYT